MLSIIIPAYNEERRIEVTLDDYYNYFNKYMKDDFEIIIVVNNSTDHTLDIAREYSKKYPEISNMNLEYKSGKGGAVIAGFKKAKGEFIGFVDADNSIIHEEYFKIYDKLKSFDGAIGSRRALGSVIFPKRTWMQEFTSLVFKIVMKLSVGLIYNDTQCGAKIFKREVVERYLEYDELEKGWGFDIDLLNICYVNGFNIYECPINWTDCEGSKLTFIDGFKATLNVFYTKSRSELIPR